jgi:uncharacterized protein (DUF427 family)
MSLTVGAGPFGHRPAGRFDFDPPARVRYVERSPRRLRVILRGETVVESRDAKLLHESGGLPVYYFPEEDVRLDLVPAGILRRHDALPGHVAPEWAAMDAWYEEEEQIFGHPRDPYHRIDVLDSSRHVRVSIGGELAAETRRPLILFETSLPPRYYLDPVDVRGDLLTPHEKTTRCAYKGVATYWSVASEQAIVWTYGHPNPEVERIKGLLAFFNERVELEVDGESQEAPRTQWHPAGWG